jgi:hypothetical protein
MISIRVTSSQKNVVCVGKNKAIILYVKATKIASEISIIIPGFLLFSSVLAIFRNGSPPYTKISTDNTGTINWLATKVIGWYPSQADTVALKYNTGMDRSVETINFLLNICSWPL